jgi:adenylate cyclase
MAETEKIHFHQAEEIERKFLVGALPDNLSQYPSKEINQGYLIISKDGTEVRVREKGDHYFLTVKSGRGETRGESEMALGESQFNSLWLLTEGVRIEKTRYEIPYGENLVELDVYHGHLEGLVTAEVEFGTVQSSMEFIVPEWFGREVTEDRGYKNQSLAVYGIPRRP